MRRLIPIVVLLTALLGAGEARAVAVYPVTTTADSGAGSLREAIEAANGSPGADSVPIDVLGTIALETPLPTIANSLFIGGPGAANLTIERKAGAPPFRILTFTGASVVRDVTISGGIAPLGAGILSEIDKVTLIGVVVTGNEARAEGASEAVARGGGVAGLGPVTVIDSTIHGNKAVAQSGSSETTASGGGIYALGSLILERSTISGNTVEAGGSASQIRSQGGGVQAQEATIDSSTFSGNSAVSAGLALGANLSSFVISTVRNTIVAEPLGGAGNCNGAVFSGGYNLDEDGSCEFSEGSDLAGVDPLLGPLADNGGPTPTHALPAGSIAIDRGNSFGAGADQRGLPRPSDFPAVSNKEGGDGSDIGAFELQAPAPADGGGTPVLVQVLAGDRQPPNTRIVSGPARAGFDRLAKFRFASSEAQSRFQCKVDKERWRGCRNPFKRRVSAAAGNGRKHVFKVRAIDRFGNVDPTPARFGWRVKTIGG